MDDKIVDLINCLLFDVQLKIFRVYSGQQKIQQYKKTIEQKGWRNYITTGSMTFDCHWISLKGLIGTNNVAFCSGFRSSTFLLLKSTNGDLLRFHDSRFINQFSVYVGTEVQHRQHIHEHI